MALTLLLAEDDSGIREVLGSVLRDGGYDVIEVSDAAEGADMLDHQPHIGVLVTDVEMPGASSGLDLARHARNADVELPIVIMSGKPVDNAELPENAQFLVKPFEMRHLLRQIEAAVQASRH